MLLLTASLTTLRGVLSTLLALILLTTIPFAHAAKPRPHANQTSKILEAQRTINARYIPLIPEYTPAPEDGLASFDTLLSFTQALQYELGISPTVRNFGSGTLSAVRTRNLTPDRETNPNLVRLYNAVLWVKGYPASSDNSTTWDPVANSSLQRLYADAGLGDLSSQNRTKIWPFVCRALFRMDSFRKAPGVGTETTRQIQQFLNRRYLAEMQIPLMAGLVPCDGYFPSSRESMTSFMMGLQVELGIPPAEATGNFGVKTKASLQAIGSGNLTGILRYFFRAACWLNSPVQTPSGSKVRYVASDIQTDIETETHKSWLLAFQRFSQLNQTGRNDYQTFAQLLVSSGDPDRLATGGDCITEITSARGAALKAAGYRIIGRYLDENVLPTDPNYLGKSLKAHEPQTIIDAGLGFFPIFQYGGRAAQGFSYDIGRMHATAAHNKSMGFRIPRETCIYFAVDYDAPNEEIDANVLPYFRGVRDVLQENGGKYKYCVYGSKHVCNRVSKEGGAKWSFVAGMSWGYGGNSLGLPMPENWSLVQIKEFSFNGGSAGSWGLDNNVWREGGDPGVFRLEEQ